MSKIEEVFEKYKDDILKFYKEAGNRFFYRGLQKPPEITIVNAPENRRPRNSSHYAADILDHVYSSLGATALRSNSFFITPRMGQANTYGGIFIAMPIGEYHYTWMQGVVDLYTDRDIRFYAVHYNRAADPFELPSIRRPAADVPEFLLWAAKHGAPAVISAFLKKNDLNIDTMLADTEKTNAAFDSDAEFRAQLKASVLEWYQHRLREKIRIDSGLADVRIEEVILHSPQLLLIPEYLGLKLRDMIEDASN